MSSSFKYGGCLNYSIRFFLLVSLLFCSLDQHAQSSFVSSGKQIDNSYGSISYSVGAVFFVARNQGLIITEGIQQSYTIHAIPNKSLLRVALFPNPTIDLIYFKVENLYYKNLSYRVYDVNGRFITSGKILNEQSVLSLQNFPSNIFVVKVFRDEMEEQSFKIIKSN